MRLWQNLINQIWLLAAIPELECYFGVAREQGITDDEIGVVSSHHHCAGVAL